MTIFAKLGTKPSPSEARVLEKLLQGKENKNIAYELNLKEATVKVHIRNLFVRYGCTNRVQLALKAHPKLNGAAMTENRQTFFFDFRIYYKNKHYWGAHIKISAPDLEDASRTFLAWSSGVMVREDVDSIHIDQVQMHGDPTIEYYYPSDPELIVLIRDIIDKLKVSSTWLNENL